jgi:hypothetical protein
MNARELFANAVKIAESHGLVLGRSPLAVVGSLGTERRPVARFYLWARQSAGPARTIAELVLTEDATDAERVLGFVLDVVRTLLKDAMETAAAKATDAIEARVFRVRPEDVCNCGHRGDRHLNTDAGAYTGPCLECGLELTPPRNGPAGVGARHIFRHAKGL